VPALSSFAVLFGLLIAMIVRDAALILVLILIIWAYSSWNSDPVRDRNTVEVKRYEERQVEAQRAKVTLTQAQVVFEEQGDHEVRATVVNGSSARISDIALRLLLRAPGRR
jgi:hypothetical protein